jgi:hypothetical protein
VLDLTGIFISYREDDAKPWALLLRDELAEVFGEEHIFLDKDTLHAGSWRDQIRAALDQCRVVLVVMGRRWLDITDDRGQRRLDRADDVHRQEIALALVRPEVTVIPVRVDGAPIPRPQELPEDIRALADQQSRELSDNRARREVDLKFLIEDIGRATGLRVRTQPWTSDDGISTPGARARLWLGQTAKVLLFTLLASLSVVVAAQIGLGWDLLPEEIGFIVLIVLTLTLLGSTLRARFRGKSHKGRP